MIKIEKVLVKFLIQCVKINKSLAYSERLKLVNSIIKNSPTTKVKKYFKECCRLSHSKDFNEDEKISLNYCYQAAFLFIKIRTNF